MLILHDPACASYAVPGHVEAPFRVEKTVEHLAARHPDWNLSEPGLDGETLDDNKPLLRAHTAAYLSSLRNPKGDFDPDCPATPGINEHARRAAYTAICTAEHALDGDKVFSLMRPPGHHATRDQAMGFCYLNSIAIAALHAKAEMDLERVAIWDFDAHHGNGTEAIVAGNERIRLASIHQYPGWPGTGTRSFGNIYNFPVRPRTPRAAHMAEIQRALATLLKFKPDLLLVSAGFDAYDGDPIMQMSLQPEDFVTCGRWLRECGVRAGAILEGGYSDALPELIDGFLTAWTDAK